MLGPDRAAYRTPRGTPNHAPESVANFRTKSERTACHLRKEDSPEDEPGIAGIASGQASGLEAAGGRPIRGRSSASNAGRGGPARRRSPARRRGWTTTGTPRPSRLRMIQRSPLGWPNATNQEVGGRPRMRSRRASSSSGVGSRNGGTRGADDLEPRVTLDQPLRRLSRPRPRRRPAGRPGIPRAPPPRRGGRSGRCPRPAPAGACPASATPRPGACRRPR